MVKIIPAKHQHVKCAIVKALLRLSQTAGMKSKMYK